MYMCPPFWNLKKKKKKKRCLIPPGYTPVATYPPPPPPPRRRWRSGKKKCRSPPPPPPPPLISFFGTCASFEAGGGPKKNSMLCPPFLKFLDPPLVTPNRFGSPEQLPEHKFVDFRGSVLVRPRNGITSVRTGAHRQDIGNKISNGRQR